MYRRYKGQGHGNSDTSRLRVTGADEAKIIAKACSTPPSGFCRWTLSLIGQEVLLEEPIALLELRKSRRELDGAKEELRDINEQVHFTGQYLSTKKAYAGYKKAKDKEKYRSDHQADLVKYEASRDYLRKRADGKKLPSLAELKERKLALVNQRESLYAALEDKRISFKEIDTMLKNMDAILERGRKKLTNEPALPVRLCGQFLTTNERRRL